MAEKLKIMKKYIVIPFLFMAVNLFSQPINQQPNNQQQQNNNQQMQQQNNQQQMQQQNNNQQMQQQNNQQYQQQDQYQPPQQQNNMYNNNMNYYGNKSAKYRKMKVNGIVLASVGGGLLIGGLALLTTGISNQVPVNNNNGTVFNGGAGAVIETIGGGILTVVGALMVTGGTVMAVIGSKKEKDMAMSNRNNKVSVIIAPTAFKIAYTF